jgi:hypothetical protein
MLCICFIDGQGRFFLRETGYTHLDTGLAPSLEAMLSDRISLLVSESKTVVALEEQNRKVMKKELVS